MENTRENWIKLLGEGVGFAPSLAFREAYTHEGGVRTLLPMLQAGQPPQASFGTTSAYMGEQSHEGGVRTLLPMLQSAVPTSNLRHNFSCGWERSHEGGVRTLLPMLHMELYEQANGNGTSQRLLFVYPDTGKEPFPGVAAPFYFPEAMLGFDPVTGEELPKYRGITMLTDLVKRGYGAVCADAYHLTYVPQDRDRDDFTRWRVAAEALREKEPGLTGMGKLVADTRLLLDFLEAEPRIDSSRLGIAGHSLGGKMAFYTGCLDSRVKAIFASDFGMPWDSTNWTDIWYWGERVTELKAAGLDHGKLLGCSGGVPFCLLAGLYDGEESLALMQTAAGYGDCPEKLCYIHHSGGHRPTAEALEEGYRFLDKWLQ